MKCSDLQNGLLKPSLSCDNNVKTKINFGRQLNGNVHQLKDV